MKLLIVDDEDLTRSGLIQSIDWEALGISQILQADDGQSGLMLAKKVLPDIVLTDVRMPRMNGIEMALNIQQLNPDCPILFMSGYSDKEYLKAAIKLHAVHYVEKPIDPQEVTDAIQEAIRMVTEKKLRSQTQLLFQKEAASRLALRLTKPAFTMSLLPDYFPDGSRPPVCGSTYFSTLIIQFSKQLSEFVETDLSQLLLHLESLAKKRGLHQIHTLKQEEFLILHLFGNEKPSSYALERFCKDIYQPLEPHRHFFIALGKTVQGPEKVYLSYQSAVILLQNAFFCPYGSILLADDAKSRAPLTVQSFSALPDRFGQFLVDREIRQARELSAELYQKLLYNRSMLEHQAKDIYYRLLSAIGSAIYRLKLSAPVEQTDPESPMELVARCNTLDELHQLLTIRLNDFAGLLAAAPQENSTVFLIRDYISRHYSSDTLSIRDISDHVHLSSSYICTLFKTETGQTLNQYITEYRMEKAKQLLSDPRNKITEISAMVGYADGNYFGKSFKKSVGFSPSEYRERENHEAFPE